MPGSINSSVVIARLLDSEGFTDHVGNVIERYWMRNICQPRRRKGLNRLADDITTMCEKLTPGEKLVLGKFIAWHKKMSFDTGLRMGLSAFARKSDKEYALRDDQMEKPDAPSPRETHKTIPVSVWADVDEGIAALVKYLNTIPGVRTSASCQGTIGEGGPRPYPAYVMANWDDQAFSRLKAEFNIEPMGKGWGYIRRKGADGKQKNAPHQPPAPASSEGNDAQPESGTESQASAPERTEGAG